MKNYRLYHPNTAGSANNFYNQIADYAEDHAHDNHYVTLLGESLYHFSSTQEMLDNGRAHISFGMNGDAGDIIVSTYPDGCLHLKAIVRVRDKPSWDSLYEQAWDSLYEWLLKNGWLREGKKIKKTSKIPTLPKRPADVHKWARVWDILGPKIKEDPSLERDYKAQSIYLYQMADSDQLQFTDDTLRKIVRLGLAEKIPSLTDFQRKNQL